MLIKAVATGEGLNLIEEDIKNHIKKFVVLGDTLANNDALDNMLDNAMSSYEMLSPFIIYENSIHSAYYDDNGFLTFELEIDYSVDLQKYIYGVAVISEIIEGGESLPVIISLSKSGRIFKSAGIGGLYIYKINVTGTPAEIIYQNNDYINLETARMLDRDTLNNAKEFADNQDTINLQTAKTYADDKDKLKSDITHDHNLTDIEVKGILPLAKGGTGSSTGSMITAENIQLNGVIFKPVAGANSGHLEMSNNGSVVTRHVEGMGGHLYLNWGNKFPIILPNGTDLLNELSLRPKYPNYDARVLYPPNARHNAPSDGWIKADMSATRGDSNLYIRDTVVFRSYFASDWGTVSSGLYPVKAGDMFQNNGGGVITFYYNR